MPAVLTQADPKKILKKYEKHFHNDIALLKSSKEGLAPQAAFDLASVGAFSNEALESILDVSYKTLTNYLKQKTNLNPSVSEKILTILALFEKGISIFGSKEEFIAWINRPAYGLGNRKPGDLLDTMTGIYLIGEELSRIEYGDLA